MQRKLIIIGLCVALISVCLVACGKKGGLDGGTYTYEAGSKGVSYFGDFETITFGPNKSFTIVLDDGSTRKGTYTVEGSTMFVKCEEDNTAWNMYDESEFDFEFSENNEKLKITDGEYPDQVGYYVFLN